MDIIKVFGSNLKNIEPHWVFLKKILLKSVVCIEHILVLLNVIEEAFLSKTYNGLQMRYRLRHINC